MKAESLINRATALGVTIELRGDKLHLSPAGRCPPEFVVEIQQNKPAILELLGKRDSGTKDNKDPWLYVAQQILNGEFDGADRSTRESLAIGLRGIRHPKCQLALKRLHGE